MSEQLFFQRLVPGWLILAGVSFIVLLFIPAPYGRHARRGWGPALSHQPGWILMETPAALGFVTLFLLRPGKPTAASWAFLILWEIHYLYRAFIYPFTLRESRRNMLVSVVLLGAIFNLGNVYLNGRYLFTFSGQYPDAWIRQPQFLAGAGLFLAGMAANRHADHLLRTLRRQGEGGYSIPTGGLFRLISCPNYLGEIVQWSGWAIATWSLPGLAFAIWTFANLAPRAWSHHRWYREHFPNYPPERGALLPALWRRVKPSRTDAYSLKK